MPVGLGGEAVVDAVEFGVVFLEDLGVWEVLVVVFCRFGVQGEADYLGEDAAWVWGVSCGVGPPEENIFGA